MIRTTWTLSLAALLLAGTAAAQDVPRTASEIEKREKEGVKVDPREPGSWEVDSNVSLLVTQSAFSNNWSKGDKGAFSWTLLGDLKAERQYSRNFNLFNNLVLAYGQTGKQVVDPNDPSKNVWEPPSKTTDQILAESTGRFTLGGFADPFVGIRFDSQFFDESDPAGTLSFNPLRFTETAGFARVFQKTENAELISRLGIGFRQTFGKEFVDGGPGKRSFSTNDGGVEWLTTITEPLAKEDKLVYKGRLLVFAPLFYSQSADLTTFDREAIAADPGREEVADFWRVPDVDFQNEIVAKVTKLVTVNLLFHMVYDKFDANTNVDLEKPIEELTPVVDGSIRKAAQWRETMAIGLTYALF